MAKQNLRPPIGPGDEVCRKLGRAILSQVHLSVKVKTQILIPRFQAEKFPLANRGRTPFGGSRREQVRLARPVSGLFTTTTTKCFAARRQTHRNTNMNQFGPKTMKGTQQFPALF